MKLEQRVLLVFRYYVKLSEAASYNFKENWKKKSSMLKKKLYGWKIKYEQFCFFCC